MKRFSKILTLILALAVILTAFTVVALAEYAAAPGYIKKDPSDVWGVDGSSESLTTGSSWYNENKTFRRKSACSGYTHPPQAVPLPSKEGFNFLPLPLQQQA